jgi:hypothetical protein
MCGYALFRIHLGEYDLIEHFGRSQVPDEPAYGGGAERAAHPAADLCRDANGVPVLIAHDDGLDGVIVGQSPKILDGAVLL